MRIIPSRAIGVAVASVLALSLAGCGGRAAKGDLPYVARDVGTLYAAAKDRLDRRQYKLAAALFDEVERQHPYSVWARRAQLMSAFSYYVAHDYTKAIDSAQRFLSIHPGNRDAPYAYYLISLCYYEQISDVTRDQKITEQALDSLGELTRRYPNSKYAADARLKVDLVRDHLAGKEMEVGRFYETRGQWLAATIRFRKVVDDFQTTTHVPEALMRLTETYTALGVPEEAKKAAAVLGANYPGSIWYKRAFDIAERHPGTAFAAIPPGTPIVPISVRAAPVGGSDTAAAAPSSPEPAPAADAAPPSSTNDTIVPGNAAPAPASTPDTTAPGSAAPAVTPDAGGN